MRSFFFIILLALGLRSFSQNDMLLHKVKPGETLSSIATLYHTTVAEILKLNSLKKGAVLKTGKSIILPAITVQKPVATPPPIVQVPATVVKEVPKKTPEVVHTTINAIVPDKNSFIHIVGKSETLYAISKKYGVTVDQIKSWNGLIDNNIHENQKLVIGSGQSAQLAVKTDSPVAKPVIIASDQSTPETAVQKPVVKIVPQVQTPAASTPTSIPVVSKKETITVNQPGPTDGNSEGYFSQFATAGGNQLTGDAGTFKTSSGWLDKKYYILINNIDPGTVVKVVFGNKKVYAKVLGPLPEVKGDNGILLRICNAAAVTLGATDARFPVVINF